MGNSNRQNMKNYSSFIGIMINKLSKFILTARKRTFFFPTENMDVCKRMCAIKQLHQLVYARVKLLPTPWTSQNVLPSSLELLKNKLTTKIIC